MSVQRSVALCLIVVTHVCHPVTATAPLYGYGTAEAIKDQFIVLAKRGAWMHDYKGPDEAFSIQAFCKDIQESHPGLKVLRQFDIGEKFFATLVSLDSARVHALLERDDVELVEANQRIWAIGSKPRDGSRDASNGGVQLPTADRERGDNWSGLGQDDPNKTETVTVFQTSRISRVCLEQYTRSNLWGLSRISQRRVLDYDSATYSFSDVDDGSDVDVYVVDSGVNTQHAEFDGRATWGMTSHDVEHEGPEDLNGHGTHVASTAAGRNVGVAKEANVFAAKVLDKDGGGAVGGAIEALVWIAQRVKGQIKNGTGKKPKAVINMSLGSTTYSYLFDEAVIATVDMGISVVVAAGNDEDDACSTSPSRVASAVTVGATDKNDLIASFSNFGPCVDILAPGSSILGASNGGPASYALYSGTSQAAPHVSGVIARYLSSVRSLNLPSPASIKAFLSDTASFGYINFPWSLTGSTPNRLLYKACEDGFVTDKFPDPPVGVPSTSGAGRTALSLTIVICTSLTTNCLLALIMHL